MNACQSVEDAQLLDRLALQWSLGPEGTVEEEEECTPAGLRLPGRRGFLAGLGALACAALLPDAGASAARLGASQAASYGSKVLAAKFLMLREIRRCLGKPYVWGAEGPDRFDCSGLVMWLYGKIGIRLPRVAVEQGSVGIRVPDRLRFGDVLLFKRKGPGWHIGFYLTKWSFVHAANKNEGVIISSARDSYWRTQFRDARRYIDEG